MREKNIALTGWLLPAQKEQAERAVKAMQYEEII